MVLEADLAIELIAPPLALGALISISHGLLGLEVLKRGVIFLDLAVAHIASLGLIIGFLLTNNSSSLVALSLAFIAAVIACTIFYRIEKFWPNRVEAIIGVSFILAASSTFILLANHPHSDEIAKKVLAGEILFVDWAEVVEQIIITILVVSGFAFSLIIKRPIIFYLLFALTITSSVKAIGVYMVFASLIIPALIGEKTTRPMTITCAVGFICIFVGVVSGVLLDKPMGPTIVLTYCFVALIYMLISYIRKPFAH